MEFSTIAKLVAVLESCHWIDTDILGFVEAYEALEPGESQKFHMVIRKIGVYDGGPVGELYGASIPMDDKTVRSELGPQLYNALKRAGFTDIAELTHLTQQEVRKIRMIGPKRVEQLRKYLASSNLSFAN